MQAVQTAAPMNKSDISSILDTLGVLPSKKLGQNFLIDANVARWIVDQLDIQLGDTVVEVGPGTGALTEHYVNLAKGVVLVEYDSRLAEHLKEKFKDSPNVTVHHADGVQFDVRKLFPSGPIKFLGNLPYSSGGAIMANFLNSPSPVISAVLMLQKEFIDRIVAKPKTKSYGVLTLRVQSQWDATPLKTVPPEAFYPRPKIDSTVMLLTKKEALLPIYSLPLFDTLVRRGFAQRRKQLKKHLPDDADWPVVAADLGVKETVRAEELSLEQWVDLTRAYDSHPLKDIPQKNDELFDVVDENDEVLRQETRQNVHRENLLHRAVHIFVFNKHGDLFLQYRSRAKDKCPSTWDSSAAGHLDAGESYEESAMRELDEELGIKNVDIQKIAKLKPVENTGWEFIELFLARYDGAMTYPASEIETGQWFSVDLIQEWISKRANDFAPGFVECWNVFYPEWVKRQQR